MLSGMTIVIETEPTDTIQLIKQKIQNKTGIHEYQIRLCTDRVLQDDYSLTDYRIQQFTTVYQVERFQDLRNK